MRLQDGAIIFNVPALLTSPIFLLAAGFIIGAIVAAYIVSRSSKPDRDFSNSQFDNKGSVLANISPGQVIARSRALFELVRTFNKISSLVATHKPVISMPITRINSSANEGVNVILRSDKDFYEMVGSWSSMEKQLMSLLENMEHYSSHKAIADELYRSDLIEEINSGKRSLERTLEE